MRLINRAFSATFNVVLASLIIPGGAGALGNGPGKMAWYSRIGFYVTTLSYLIDRFFEPEDFLSRDFDDRYDKVLENELYVIGGFYVVNVLFSILAGIEYGKTQKFGIEVSTTTLNNATTDDIVYKLYEPENGK